MRSRTTQMDMFRMIGVILLVWALAHLMSGAFRAFESLLHGWHEILLMLSKTRDIKAANFALDSLFHLLVRWLEWGRSMLGQLVLDEGLEVDKSPTTVAACLA